MMDGGCRGFCAVPHGWLSLLGIFMALVSWGLSIGVHATCFFVRGNNDRQTGFGIWTKENIVQTVSSDAYQCQEYTWAETHLMDTKWNAASGLAFTAGVMGFIFAVLMIGSSCAAYKQSLFKLAAANYVVAGILDFCTLVGVNSNICTTFTLSYASTTDFATECTFSTGAALAIAAGVCYFITAAICFFIPPARKRGIDETDDDVAVAVAPPGTDETTKVETTAQKDVTETEVDMDLQSPTSPADQVKEPAGDDAKPSDESDTSSEDTASEIEEDIGKRGFWLIFWDDILFLIGSVFFMWLSVLDLQWGKTVQAWVDADLIDGQFSLRDNKVKELSEYDWADDDYVFRTRFHWVSKYQIVYFIAGAAFMIDGFLDFFATPGIGGLWFVFAGTFGLVAAWLAERDADLSNIFNLMSAHLYMFEAIGLVFNRNDFSGRLGFWVRMNSICFVIATCIDVAMSYTSVLKVYNIALVKTDTAGAALWLFCAVFYLCATLYAKRSGYFDHQEDETPQQQQDDIPNEKDGLGEENKAVSDKDLNA